MSAATYRSLWLPAGGWITVPAVKAGISGDLVGVEVCCEEIVVTTALRAITEPAAIQFGLEVHRTSSSRRLLPSTLDFLLQPPVIADGPHCSREIHRAMQMGVGREVLWEENSTHAKINREASHVTPTVHSLVEQMAERAADALDARKRQFAVGIEGDRVGVIVVSSPIDEGCALKALEVCCHMARIIPSKLQARERKMCVIKNAP